MKLYPVKRKIGEILIANKFITREMLAKALEYQKNFGGNVTQFLINAGYVTEESVAKCVSEQFGYPYLPLKTYDIPDQIIKLIPHTIAAKYWLIPIDKLGELITIVMADPSDEEAIKEVEELTHCTAQPFVGIISDILKAIEQNYKIHISAEISLNQGKEAPLFLSTDKAYKGIDQRKSIRINANITVHFPAQELYKKSETKNVSKHGFLFESNVMLPVGSYIVLAIDLPEKFSPHPIAAVGQVVRVIPLDNKKFDIAVKTIKIHDEDIEKVIKYAVSANSPGK